MRTRTWDSMMERLPALRAASWWHDVRPCMEEQVLVDGLDGTMGVFDVVTHGRGGATHDRFLYFHVPLAPGVARPSMSLRRRNLHRRWILMIRDRIRGERLRTSDRSPWRGYRLRVGRDADDAAVARVLEGITARRSDVHPIEWDVRGDDLLTFTHIGSADTVDEARRNEFVEATRLLAGSLGPARPSRRARIDAVPNSLLGPAPVLAGGGTSSARLTAVVLAFAVVAMALQFVPLRGSDDRGATTPAPRSASLPTPVAWTPAQRASYRTACRSDGMPAARCDATMACWERVASYPVIAGAIADRTDPPAEYGRAAAPCLRGAMTDVS